MRLNKHATRLDSNHQFDFREIIDWFAYTIPAVWRVDKKPHTIADNAIRAMILLREGAKAPKTPI